MHAITRITPPPKGAFLSSAFASGARKPFEYAPSSQVSRSQRLLASIPRGHDRIHVLRRNLYPSQATAGGPVIPRQEAGDPFGLLLRQRIVFLGNQVDDFTADAVISQLLLLDAQDPKKARIHVVSRKSFTLPRDFTHLLAMELMIKLRAYHPRTIHRLFQKMASHMNDYANKTDKKPLCRKHIHKQWLEEVEFEEKKDAHLGTVTEIEVYKRGQRNTERG